MLATSTAMARPIRSGSTERKSARRLAMTGTSGRQPDGLDRADTRSRLEIAGVGDVAITVMQTQIWSWNIKPRVGGRLGYGGTQR